MCMFVYTKQTQNCRARDRKCVYVYVSGESGLLSGSEG